MTRSSPLVHRPALDGLRAVAILSVVGVHAFHWPAGGGIGVDLFFVISGFLITTLLLDERSRTGAVSLTGFWIRRGRRLVPALAVMLAVYATALWATGQLDHDGRVRILLGGAYLENAAVVRGGLSPHEGVNPLWSLAQEEQFYLLWPLLLFLLLRGRVMVALAVVCVLAAAAFAYGLTAPVGFSPFTVSPAPRSLGILVGCAAALACWRWRRSPGWLAAAACLLVCAELVLPVWVRDRIFFGPLLIFAVCSAVAVTHAWHRESVVTRALSWRPLVFVGAISYSLYLWHLPLLELTGSTDAGVVQRSLVVAAAFVVATLSYRYVEQPFRRRRERAHALGPVAA